MNFIIYLIAFFLMGGVGFYFAAIALVCTWASLGLKGTMTREAWTVLICCSAIAAFFIYGALTISPFSLVTK